MTKSWLGVIPPTAAIALVFDENRQRLNELSPGNLVYCRPLLGRGQ